MDARANGWMMPKDPARASCHAVPRLARRSMRRACGVYTETLSMPSAPTSRRAPTTSRRGVRASERALSTVTAHTHDEKEINLSSSSSSSSSPSWCVIDPSIDSRARAKASMAFCAHRSRARPPPVVIHPSPSARVLSRPSSSWPSHHHHHHHRRRRRQSVALFRASSVVCANSLATTTHAARAPTTERSFASPRARPGRDRSIEPVMFRQIFTGRSAQKSVVVVVVGRARARGSRVEDMGVFWVIVCELWCQ